MTSAIMRSVLESALRTARTDMREWGSDLTALRAESGFVDGARAEEAIAVAMRGLAAARERYRVAAEKMVNFDEEGA